MYEVFLSSSLHPSLHNFPQGIYRIIGNIPDVIIFEYIHTDIIISDEDKIGVHDESGYMNAGSPIQIGLCARRLIMNATGNTISVISPSLNSSEHDEGSNIVLCYL